MKMELTFKQVLGFIIAGIKNGQFQAALNIAEDCIDHMNKEEEKDDNRTDFKEMEEGSINTR